MLKCDVTPRSALTEALKLLHHNVRATSLAAPGLSETHSTPAKCQNPQHKPSWPTFKPPVNLRPTTGLPKAHRRATKPTIYGLGSLPGQERSIMSQQSPSFRSQPAGRHCLVNTRRLLRPSPRAGAPPSATPRGDRLHTGRPQRRGGDLGWTASMRTVPAPFSVPTTLAWPGYWGARAAVSRRPAMQRAC